MARDISSANATALAARALVARDFLWIIVRDRTTGDPVQDGMWSDVGNISAPILNADTGEQETRDFYGAGALIAIDDIPLVANITVQNVNITLSQVDAHVADLVRTYDAKQATVEIYRGLFDPNTRLLVDPATRRWVGFVDSIVINTPVEGDAGSVVMTCASHTQEMMRSNSDTRSPASQRLRSSTDDFFDDTAVVSEWQHFWGQTSGAIITTTQQSSSGSWLKP